MLFLFYVNKNNPVNCVQCNAFVDCSTQTGVLSCNSAWFHRCLRLLITQHGGPQFQRTAQARNTC